MQEKFLRDVYSKFPEIIIQLISDVPNEKLFAPIREGGWSVHQIVRHIVDAEIVYYQRIKRYLTEDVPQLIGWQPTDWLNLDEVSETSFEASVQSLKTIRLKLYQILLKQPELAWNRAGVHPRYGTLTLKELVEQQNHHSLGHTEAIRKFLLTS